jgi:hypothetical protein
VATVSFLASRAAPTGGFWIALAGGVALARVAQLRGLRQGFGASLAATIESVAIMGPARFGVPLTQALTAPMLGRLEARSVRPWLQWLACALARLANNAIATAFFIWITGFDAYSGTYESVGDRLGLDIGTRETLILTALGLLAWAGFASAVQVGVYRRGLRRWPDEQSAAPAPQAEPASLAPDPAQPATRPPRFDPRAVVVAAVVAFAVLLASTDWLVLGIVAAWLALAFVTCRPDFQFLPTGLVLTALIAGSVLAFGLLGGLGADTALRRAARAALLVLVATWLRAAARAEGLRDVSARALVRLRRIPSLPEARRILDELASEGRLLAAGRSLTARLRGVRRRPVPILDAILDWVSHESARFRARP